MTIVSIGPDGMVLVYALLVSIVVTVLSWRRVKVARAAAVLIPLGVALAIVQYLTLEPADIARQLVRASFIVVPTVVLLAGLRLHWLAQRAWLFILVGPVTFVACYVGICEICDGAGLI